MKVSDRTGDTTAQWVEQVRTINVSFEQIVRCKSFALGVEDYRSGAPPRFDREEN
jgi:hypothetical protein